MGLLRRCCFAGNDRRKLQGRYEHGLKVGIGDATMKYQASQFSMRMLEVVEEDIAGTSPGPIEGSVLGVVKL